MPDSSHSINKPFSQAALVWGACKRLPDPLHAALRGVAEASDTSPVRVALRAVPERMCDGWERLPSQVRLEIGMSLVICEVYRHTGQLN